MNIEKSLRNYLNSKGPKIKYDSFCVLAENNSNELINVIFKLVNEEIDSMNDTKILDRVVELLKYVEVIIGNCDDTNRKIVIRKIHKLLEKLPRNLEEGRRKYFKPKKIKSEFNKVKEELEHIEEMCEKKETKQYNFMQYLVEETKNVEYLEYAFKKMPALMNVKDKDEVPLFRNLVKSYLDSIIDFDEENILYYKNLISLIMSQKSFHLTEIEKRKCLEEIYKCINKLSFNKKRKKKNNEKLELLDKLTRIIKGSDKRYLEIDDIASKYNIKIDFDEKLLEDAKLVRTANEGYMTDRETVDSFTISMDKEASVEIDDALSCEKLPNGNYLLGVHIASVLGYFDYDSEIVQEAINRNQSIYLPHRYQSKDNDFNRTIPIFPYEFCAEKASLKENEPRLARSYFFEIDEDGNVVNEVFKKTIVKNDRQMTYDDVNSILIHGTKDEQLQELINNLSEVTRRLDNKYVSTDLYEKIKESIKDTSELRVRKAGSENIVYQSMLLTGNRVAEFFAKKDLPLVYRVHYVNEENNRKLQAMIDNLNQVYKGNLFKNLYQLINGIYPKGWYAEEGRHSGLDLDHYCHCTSTLRRAADIIVEHALEVCYDKEPTKEEINTLKEEIADRVVEINAKQSPIDYFLKEYQKKHKALTKQI